MKTLILILLFSFVSVFAQTQNQQQRANNNIPYTVAIHRLNDKALNDSLLIETEDTTNFFSRRTSVGKLKDYVNSNTLNIAWVISFADTNNLVVTVTTPQAYDDDGDSIILVASKTSICNFQTEFQKPNGNPSDLSSFENGSLYEGQFPVNVQMANDAEFARFYGTISAFYTVDALAELHFTALTNPIGSTTGGASPSSSNVTCQLILHK